jgi:hypothetical protein
LLTAVAVVSWITFELDQEIVAAEFEYSAYDVTTQSELMADFVRVYQPADSDVEMISNWPELGANSFLKVALL